MKRFLILLFMWFVSSCGSDDGGTTSALSSSNDSVTYLQAKFVDSEVRGMSYSTPTTSGVTDANGAFECLADETVTFKVGAVTVGSAVCNGVLTPYDLNGATSTDSNVINMTKFFMSLDADQDASNGIDVQSHAASLTTSMTVNWSNTVDYSGLLTDLGVADVGNIAATSHINATMSTLQSAWDGTYSGSTTVTAGDCSSYSMAVTVNGTDLQSATLTVPSSGTLAIPDSTRNYRTISSLDVSYSGVDNTYCQQSHSVNATVDKVFISGSVKIDTDGNPYIEGTFRDVSVCSNGQEHLFCSGTFSLTK